MKRGEGICAQRKGEESIMSRSVLIHFDLLRCYVATPFLHKEGRVKKGGSVGVDEQSRVMM